jgi:arylsulfatase A-like enzyme
MYEEALRTPMLIRYPNQIEKGINVHEMVLNLDLAPTLLSAAGIEIPQTMQGRSMTDLWMGERDKVWRDAIYYHYYEKGFGATPHYGIRTNRYKLIHFYDPIDSWELYDLETDPSEVINMIDDPANHELISTLKNRLTELQEEFQDTQL